MGTAPDSTSPGALTGRSGGPWHEAVAFASPAELVAGLAPRVANALRSGDSVTAVLDDEAGARLRAALGSASDAVDFPDPREVHSVPGFTTAARWARNGRQLHAPAARALIVGQQLLGLPGCGPDYWARVCLGLEVAAAGLPLTVLCPFPDAAADWSRVRPTHPQLTGNNGSTANPAYRSPRDVVGEHPLPPPAELGPPVAEFMFRGTDLGALRHLAAEIGARSGLDSERTADVVLAVNELASNSIEHGPGSGRLRMWIDNGLLAEVADAGRLTEPFPGLAQPPPTGARGRGFWLAGELSDVMEVWDHAGTVVRLSFLL
jgi:anti-sigma regulatory factor (Ser/Thr protein kinase)